MMPETVNNSKGSNQIESINRMVFKEEDNWREIIPFTLKLKMLLVGVYLR